MAKLLDNRVVGGNADVIPRTFDGTTPGFVLKVSSDGKRLEFGAPSGYTGSAGVPGPAGFAGSAGAPGGAGPAGFTGSQGEAGPAGGYTGSAGFVGSQGLPGAPGGYTGSQGGTGFTGSQGPQGIQGLSGTPSTDFQAVGTYTLAWFTGGSGVSAGSTVSGSDLRVMLTPISTATLPIGSGPSGNPSSIFPVAGTATLPGTWRAMAACKSLDVVVYDQGGDGNSYLAEYFWYPSLWVRVS